MKHTPYGYDIVGGVAVVNEEQAAAIRQTCENYLSGMSMTQAARTVGINMNHSGVKRLMLNTRSRFLEVGSGCISLFCDSII